MGIENSIERMPKKRRKLFLDLTSVGIIFTLIYAFYSAGQLFVQGKGYLSFFNMGTFTPIVVALVFLWLARSILLGKSKNPKSTPQRQPQRKPVYNPPPKKKPYLSVENEKKIRGTVRCPVCNTLVLGYQCQKCGWRR